MKKTIIVNNKEYKIKRLSGTGMVRYKGLVFISEYMLIKYLKDKNE